MNIYVSILLYYFNTMWLVILIKQVLWCLYWLVICFIVITYNIWNVSYPQPWGEIDGLKKSVCACMHACVCVWMPMPSRIWHCAVCYFLLSPSIDQVPDDVGKMFLQCPWHQTPEDSKLAAITPRQPQISHNMSISKFSIPHNCKYYMIGNIWILN